jgi:hypothetical protein
LLLQQFYNKAIYKAKRLGDQGRRDANKYYSGTGSGPGEQPREDPDPDDAPEGGVDPLLITGGAPVRDELSAVVVPAGGLFARTQAMFGTYSLYIKVLFQINFWATLKGVQCLNLILFRTLISHIFIQYQNFL